MKKRLMTAGLILLFFFALWYFVGGITYRGPQLSAPVKDKKEAAGKRTDEKGSEKTVNYGSILEKSIFNPDRKYSEKPAQVETARNLVPPPVMPQLVLKGIAQGTDNEYVAYISMDGKKAQPFHIGDRAENIKVVSITATDVTIRWNESDINLSMVKVKSMGVKK